MWTEVENQTKIVFLGGNTSERAVPIHTPVHSTKDQSNWSRSSTVTPPSHMDPLARGSGIIPGTIAAAVFIGFILALYAVLWKCMVSPPQRLRKRVRV